MINVENMGVGSLLWVDGLAYAMKCAEGQWRFLDPGQVYFTDEEVSGWSEVEVVREVDHSFLEDFPVGSVITFDKGDVAVRHREDFWEVAGSSREYTFEQLETFIFDKSSVKELK